MVSLACTTTREGGVTLVTGRIENTGRRRRVRLENQLAGPVWPPRKRGVPTAGWSEDGFECVLAAEETKAVGYASPAPPADPPLVVAETDPVDAEPDDEFEPQVAVPSVEDTPGGVVRALGSSRPPRDAVPDPDTNTGTEVKSKEVDPATDSSESSQHDEASAESVAVWLDAVTDRLDTADQLSASTRVPVAADTLEEVGGLDGVRALDEQLDTDAETLREVAERAQALADRAETATVPVEPLERLV